MTLVAVVGLALPARAEEIKPAFDGLEPGITPLETYRLNELGIVREEISGRFLYIGRRSWWRPVRGKFRHATVYEDFYRKLGRPDLAEQNEQRSLVSGVFHYGGLAAVLGGGVLLFLGFKDEHFTRVKVGAGVLGGGLVMTIVGAAIQPPLVSQEEAAAMTAEYNRRLRLHLGLAVEDHALGLSLRGPW
jgi:hypothetical protein